MKTIIMGIVAIAFAFASALILQDGAIGAVILPIGLVITVEGIKNGDRIFGE